MESHSSESIGGGPSQNSGSSGSSEQQAVMDQRKRKRRISNRDSARRSRMKKQKHADDLAAELGRLGAENGRLAAAVEATAQLYLAVEAENSVLRAQAAELTQRLESLNEIINCVSSPSFFPEVDPLIGCDESFTMNNNPWNESMFLAAQAQHLLVAPADIMMY